MEMWVGGFLVFPSQESSYNIKRKVICNHDDTSSLYRLKILPNWDEDSGLQYSITLIINSINQEESSKYSEINLIFDKKGGKKCVVIFNNSIIF